MCKQEQLIALILELRQELINKGSSVTQGDIIALIALYDSLLNTLNNERDVA